MQIRSIATATVAALSVLALSALAAPASAATISAKVVDEKGQTCTLRAVRDNQGSPKAGFWVHNVYICGGETRSVFDANLTKGQPVASAANVDVDAKGSVVKVSASPKIQSGCTLRAVRDNQGSPKAGFWHHNEKVCEA